MLFTLDHEDVLLLTFSVYNWASLEHSNQITALTELQDRLTAQLGEAEARAAAAQAEMAAAATANAAAAAAAATGLLPVELVPKPRAAKFNIRREMGVTYSEYGAIRVRTIQLFQRKQAESIIYHIGHRPHPCEVYTAVLERGLPSSGPCSPSVTFQDCEYIPLLFVVHHIHNHTKARKEHPILRNFANNWATAAIAKTYMQNMRKHARRRGYIPPYQPGTAVNGE